MAFDSWFDDAGSLFVLGRTQTGKTTATREIHAENRRVSVWINGQGEDRVRNVSGKRVRSQRGLESGLADGRYKFNYLARDREQAMQELQQWAWEKAEQADRQFPMQLVGDEIHEVCPQSQKDGLAGRDEVRRIAKRGMKRNIKLVGITQDPVSMDKQTLRQREYLLVFPLTHEQGTYMSDYGVDVQRVNQQEQYAGVLYHADGRELATGVKAEGRFA